MRRGLVLGCGGIVGGAWTVGAASTASVDLLATHHFDEVEARVLRVHPTVAELAVMGPNFMHPGRRRAALETALTRLGAST